MCKPFIPEKMAHGFHPIIHTRKGMKNPCHRWSGRALEERPRDCTRDPCEPIRRRGQGSVLRRRLLPLPPPSRGPQPGTGHHRHLYIPAPPAPGPPSSGADRRGGGGGGGARKTVRKQWRTSEGAGGGRQPWRWRLPGAGRNWGRKWRWPRSRNGSRESGPRKSRTASSLRAPPARKLPAHRGPWPGRGPQAPPPHPAPAFGQPGSKDAGAGTVDGWSSRAQTPKWVLFGIDWILAPQAGGVPRFWEVHLVPLCFCERPASVPAATHELKETRGRIFAVTTFRKKSENSLRPGPGKALTGSSAPGARGPAGLLPEALRPASPHQPPALCVCVLSPFMSCIR